MRVGSKACELVQKLAGWSDSLRGGPKACGFVRQLAGWSKSVWDGPKSLQGGPNACMVVARLAGWSKSLVQPLAGWSRSSQGCPNACKLIQVLAGWSGYLQVGPVGGLNACGLVQKLAESWESFSSVPGVCECWAECWHVHNVRRLARMFVGCRQMVARDC